MTGDPWGATYYGDGSKYREPSQRELDERNAVTARAVERICEWLDDDDTATCLCKRVVPMADFESHAETCRALRREVE